MINSIPISDKSEFRGRIGFEIGTKLTHPFPDRRRNWREEGRGREGALNGTRTPVSNRDNERPFAGGPFCIRNIGIHLALAHAYVRNPTSCLGSTRVPPRKTSHAINVRGLRSKAGFVCSTFFLPSSFLLFR